MKGEKGSGLGRLLGRVERALSVDEQEYEKATERDSEVERREPTRWERGRRVGRRLWRILGLLFAREPVLGRLRPRWDHSAHVLLIALTFSHSASSFLDFPATVLHYGGWPFLLASAIAHLFLAFPLLLLELTLGQFSALSLAVAIRRICPALEGLAWASLLVSLLLLMHYVPMMTSSLAILAPILNGSLASCPRDLDTAHFRCSTPRHITACLRRNETFFFDKGRCIETGNESQLFYELLSPIDGCLQHLDANYFNEEAHWRRDSLNAPKNFSCAIGFQFKPAFLPASALAADPPFLQVPPDHQGPRWHLPLTPAALSEAPHLRTMLYPSFEHEQDPFSVACALGNYLANSSTSLEDFVRAYCARGFTSAPACLTQTLIQQEPLPPLLYWLRNFGGDPSKSSLSFENPALLVINLLVWVLIAVPSLSGPKWITKTLYVTAFVPATVGATIVVVGSLLAGFKEGLVNNLFEGHASHLGNYELWVDAIRVSVHSNMLGYGVLPLIGSHSDFVLDTIPLAMAHQLITWLLNAIIIVSASGFVGITASALGLNPWEIMGSDSSPGFSTNVFAGIDGVVYTGPLLPVSIILVFFVACYGTAVMAMESVVSMLSDASRAVSKTRVVSRYTIVAVVLIVCFTSGIPCYSRAGLAWMLDLHNSTNTLSILILITVNSLIAYGYGIRRWNEDMGLMFATRAGLRVLPTANYNEITKALYRMQHNPPRVSQKLWGWAPFRYAILGSWLLGPLVLTPVVILFTIESGGDKEDRITAYVVMGVLGLLVLALGTGRVVKEWREKGSVKGAFVPSPSWGPGPLINARGLALLPRPRTIAPLRTPQSSLRLPSHSKLE